MTHPAYYNEIDPYAAQWLRNLISAGHIAPGDVDERSIEDVRPDDLRPYRQCHFFAGIGVWSYALRRTGWPDDRAVWTGSCPCQPFSAAGKGDGFADERHLWPAWFHLITQCEPERIYGEQVASPNGLSWLDLVLADLEGASHAVEAADLCAAGVGAPHIRQRLYWMADRDGERFAQRSDSDRCAKQPGFETSRRGDVGRRGRPCVVGVPHDARGGRNAGTVPSSEGVAQAHAERDRLRIGGRAATDVTHESSDGALRVVVGNARDEGSQVGPLSLDGGRTVRVEGSTTGPTEPVRGFWRGADWIACRDGKWRPVEPGTFPLAHGAPARVGRLRAYGNAIVAPLAEAFVMATL